MAKAGRQAQNREVNTMNRKPSFSNVHSVPQHRNLEPRRVTAVGPTSSRWFACKRASGARCRNLMESEIKDRKIMAGEQACK
jgi:hypothetical protein